MTFFVSCRHLYISLFTRRVLQRNLPSLPPTHESCAKHQTGPETTPGRDDNRLINLRPTFSTRWRTVIRWWPPHAPAAVERQNLETAAPGHNFFSFSFSASIFCFFFFRSHFLNRFLSFSVALSCSTTSSVPHHHPSHSRSLPRSLFTQPPLRF